MSEELITIGVGSENPVKINSVREVFSDVFDHLGKCAKLRVMGYKVDSGVPDQPIGLGAIYDGAVNRAKGASIIGQNDFSVGLEAGVYPIGGVYIDLQFCAIIDGSGWMTIGHSGGFTYPKSVMEKVLGGIEVGDVFASMSGKGNIKSQEGAIGMLSKRFIDRTGFSRQSVLMAMIPRMSPELYEKGL